LYVCRKQGGRGLIQLEETLEILKLIENVESKEDPLIRIVRTHQHKTNLTILQNARNLKKKLQKRTRQLQDIIKRKTKERWQKKKKDAWTIPM
jgi:hypothetical protein